MKQAGLDAFQSFTESLESALSYMYLDVLGLVTCGYGNLIDTPAAATALQWRKPDGTLATREEVLAAWSLVESKQSMAKQGGGRFGVLTNIRLDKEAVQALFSSTVERNNVALCHRFSDFEDWGADAQMALHSLCWACGNAFRFPKLEAALRAVDYATAEVEIEMSKGSNPGNDLRRRNAANQLMMRNACHVQAYHLDPGVLYWPVDLARIDQDDAPTAPAISGVTTTADQPTVILHPRVPLGRPTLDDPELDEDPEDTGRN